MMPGAYPAQVYSITDPLNQGRIQMYIPQIFGNHPVQIWAPPLYRDGGSPNVGDLVWCVFQGGDSSYPTYIPPAIPNPVTAPQTASGLVLQSGSSVVTAVSGGATITFPTPFNSIPLVVVCPGDTAGSVTGAVISDSSRSPTGFKVLSFSGTTQITTGPQRINWIALGN